MKSSNHKFWFAWLSLVGTAGYLWCGWFHICVDGHLYHQDMPKWWLYCDFLWVSAFVAAAVTIARTDHRRRLLLASLLIALILSRLMLFSFGGTLMLLEIPTLIYLAWVSGKILLSANGKNHCD